MTVPPDVASRPLRQPENICPQLSDEMDDIWVPGRLSPLMQSHKVAFELFRDEMHISDGVFWTCPGDAEVEAFGS
jgi:hypothetical protein